MPPPQVSSWFCTLAVDVYADIEAEVHVGLSQDFTPGPDTFQGVLYGPGTFSVIGAPSGVDVYVRLVAPGGGEMSNPAGPVQTTALVRATGQGRPRPDAAG
jgi:hypothetical protein